jgi:hypothetical protein
LRERERERGNTYRAVVDEVDVAAGVAEREGKFCCREKEIAMQVCAVL